MTKKIAYERMGKFGRPEYLISLSLLNLIDKKRN